MIDGLTNDVRGMNLKQEPVGAEDCVLLGENRDSTSDRLRGRGAGRDRALVEGLEVGVVHAGAAENF